MARDRWYAPIEIDSTNNGFVITEDPAGAANRFAITLDAGTYYAYYGAPGISGRESLYFNIRTKLGLAGTANNYRFNTATPTSSTAQTLAGLEVERSSGAVEFRVDFQDASFTLDNRLFGFGTSATNQTSTSGSLTAPYTVRTQWTSYTLTDGTASDKRSWLMRNQYVSSERTLDAYQVEWQEDRIRRMIYENVPAAHVYEGRVDAVDAAAYYSTAQLNVADNFNAFETIWSAASRLGEVIVQFDDISDLDPVNHEYAVVRFNRQDQRSSMDFCTSTTTRGGEFHTLDVELVEVSGVFNY